MDSKQLLNTLVKLVVFIVRGDVTWSEIIIICKAKKLSSKNLLLNCSSFGDITKHLMTAPLGNQFSFVSLESQCFPQPELGTHIFLFNKSLEDFNTL